MITIVMPYFNRKEQLTATLKSIELTKYKDFEVVIIDDASKEDHRIEDLIDSFNFKLKLVRVEPEEKKWIEPHALVNKCIKECQSEIIIFQFTECLHVGDIISSAFKNVRDKMYIAFACLNLNEEWAKKIRGINNLNRELMLAEFPFLFEISGVLHPNENSWYNHSILSRRGYIFCAAFKREFYLDIGGLDEDFQYGYWYADDDFREKALKYGKIVFIDDPFVIHQWHPNFFSGYPDSLKEVNGRVLLKNRIKRGQF